MSRIQITYGTTPGPEHGGGGGSESFFILEPNEYIMEVEGRAADRLGYAPVDTFMSVSACTSLKYMSLLILFSD